MLSVSDDVSEGGTGATIKCLPRGVGKWSLRGERTSSLRGLLLGNLDLGPSSSDPTTDPSLSSAIVLSDPCLLGTCPVDDGGMYVVDGKKSNEAILPSLATPGALVVRP